MIVVADTSPVRYLILIGEIELVPKLYGRVLIPSAVFAELRASASPEPVRKFTEDGPEWLEIATLSQPIENDLLRILHLGESEAIQLATEIKADLLLIDEKRGRAVAVDRGLEIIGTIGVLLSAHRKGLVDLEESISKLQGTDFYMSSELKKQIDKIIDNYVKHS